MNKALPKIYLFFILIICFAFVISHCSIFESAISCNYQDNGYCLEISDEGSINKTDVKDWCEERSGEYKDSGCTSDGLKYTCENPEEAAYSEIIVAGESKGSLDEVIYYFYKTEITIPISDEESIRYLDSKDFCDDAGGEYVEAED
jgi:hypothetical protein